MSNTMTEATKALPVQFSTGQLLATPGALRLLEQHNISPQQLVAKHIRGDYGSVPADDAAANNEALIYGDRILSSYPVGAECVWIITEWDRSQTTLLLPTEY